MFFFVRSSVAAEVSEVLHACCDSGNAFVIQRAPLPTVWNRVRIGPDLVGAQALQVLTLAVEHSHVWTEEFVSGAGQKVAVERGDIDQAMRAVVNGIDVDKGCG